MEVKVSMIQLVEKVKRRRKVVKEIVLVANWTTSGDVLALMVVKATMIRLEEKAEERRGLLVRYKFLSLLRLHLQKFRKKEETRKKI